MTPFIDAVSFVTGLKQILFSRTTMITIWSDKGKNLMEAEKQLRQSNEKSNITNVTSDCAHKTIKWFNRLKSKSQDCIWEWFDSCFKSFVNCQCYTPPHE